MEREKFIFNSFLNSCCDFADERVSDWHVIEDYYAKHGMNPPAPPFDRRPDVICLTEPGRKIGVELKSWLNEEQIAEIRGRERIEENILDAIGQQSQNHTRHIGFIWLSAKERRFDGRDADPLREQMFELIRQVDDAWAQKPAWDRDCSDYVRDLAAFPILDKYLLGVRFHPATRSRFDIRWIRFPNRGGAYSPKQMLKTLEQAVVALRGDDRYLDICSRVGLDSVHLLVHYDFNAFAYNTPFTAPNFGIKEAADFATNVLAGDAGYFNRIFLFHCIQGEEQAYRIA